eukprot:328863_1
MSTTFFIFMMITATFSSHYFTPPDKYSKVCNVIKYGAKGDGKTNDTLSILAAIKDCYSNNITGQLLFPTGYTFLSSALSIQYGINCSFKIEQGATLLATNNKALWPGTLAFINIQKLVSFVFEGSGTIDGNGFIWWKNASQFRPKLMNAKEINGLIIRNLFFTNCANHCLELGANYAEIYNISIMNPPSNNNTLNATHTSHNTDGIDVHGTPFYVHDCNISTGDDNIAIHANDTLIENCFFGYGHGTSIGSLGDGSYIKNVTVNNCTYHETDDCCHIKVHPGSTGHLYDVRYTNIYAIGVSLNSLGITEYYDGNQNVSCNFWVENILYENITSYQNSTKVDQKEAGEFMCQPSTPCKNITMKNIKIKTTAGTKNQWVCQETQIFATNVSPPIQSCL